MIVHRPAIMRDEDEVWFLGTPQHKIIREVEYSSFIGAEEYAIGTFSLYTFNDGRLKILISEKVWRLLYLPR